MTAARRRRWLLGGAALSALGAGAGWSLFRARVGAPAADVLDELWSLRFPRPEGGELALAALRGRPWLLNFWATWCAPCIKEMPELDRFRLAYAGRGWEVVGLAVDNPAPVRDFLQRSPVSFPIGLAGFAGAELIKRLGNSSGGLPFTAAFDSRGRLEQRKLGATSYEELVRWGESVK